MERDEERGSKCKENVKQNKEKEDIGLTGEEP